jgi:hypothetical protein
MRLGATSMLARVELRRAWRTLLALGVLAGITLGIALAATQVARRTATAYERLVEAAGTPDAIVLVVGGDRAVAPLEDLPAIQQSWRTTGAVARVDRAPLRYLALYAGGDAPPKGLFTPVYVDGHAPDPASETDLVVSEALAHALDLRVGDELPLSFLTNQEVTEFDTGFGAPDGPTLPMRITGIVRAVDDDQSSQAFGTTALARRLAAAASSTPAVLVRLRGGADAVPAFRRSVQQLATASQPDAGAGEFLGYQVQSPLRQRAAVDVTTRVLVIGLLVFASATALAGLLACALTLRRSFSASELSPATLAALGATGEQIRRARLAATAPFVALGTLVALAVGVSAAGLGPAGSTARREPAPGWSPNVAVLAWGTLVVAVALLGVALLATALRRRTAPAPRPSAISARLGRMGAPPAVALGSRYALDPGRGRGALPVRAALAAAAVGVTGVVAILVWSTSVGHLVERPERWGWDADALVADVQPANVRALVDDPRTAAVAVVQQADLDVAGHTTSASAFVDRKGNVGWTITDGRMPRRNGEIALGARLARTLDKDVGSRVAVFSRAGRRELLDVVGIGSGPDTNNDQFANGAVVSPDDLARVALTDPFNGAAIVYRPGDDAERAAAAIGRDHEVTGPERPADLDNLDQLGRLPALLVAVLVLLVVAVLFHVLVTLVRRRRNEFDTLRAVGLRPAQLARTVVVTALVFAAVGVGIGAPLGFVVGRFAWRVTQDALYIESAVASPVLVLLGVAAVAFAAAVIVAAWPAWTVAHRRAAARSERVTSDGTA